MKAGFAIGFTPFFNLEDDTFRAIVLSIFRVEDKIRTCGMFRQSSELPYKFVSFLFFAVSARQILHTNAKNSLSV